jgi:hypothetical protein
MCNIIIIINNNGWSNINVNNSININDSNVCVY